MLSRQLIFIVIALSVAIPLVIRIGLPNQVTSEVSNVYESIEQLDSRFSQLDLEHPQHGSQKRTLYRNRSGNYLHLLENHPGDRKNVSGGQIARAIESCHLSQTESEERA